jgi:hypothetical protein
LLATAFTYKEELKNASTEESLESYRKVEEAQDVFDATPAGLKVLKDLLQTSWSNAQLEARYQRAKTVRTTQLQALKALDLKKIDHSFVQVPEAFDNSFPPDDLVRSNKNGKQTMTDINNISAPWLNTLNSDEIAQLRWMTDTGAMQTNKHIAGINTYKAHHGIWTAENLDERMEIIDSALAKYKSKEPVLVYRGIHEGMLPVSMQDNYRVPTEDKQAAYLSRFKVGETFETQYYMPTSYMPETAKKFSKFNVIMEIKTRSAAPVAPLSASRTEQEALLPRGSKYRVLAIKENILYARGQVEATPVTVIQLEEMS